jgi:excisionase family DNA binding protein
MTTTRTPTKLPINQDPLLSTTDVCETLGIHPRTLYKWVKSGKFPGPIRISPRRLRWRRSAVEQFVRVIETVAPATAGGSKATA